MKIYYNGVASFFMFQVYNFFKFKYEISFTGCLIFVEPLLQVINEISSHDI